MIELNLKNPSEIVDSGLKIVENDSGQVLRFKIFDGEAEKDLAGCAVRIRFRSLNGYVCDEPANIIDDTTGEVSYCLLGTEFAFGPVMGIISVYDSADGRTSTCRFEFECIDGLNSDSSVKASKYYSELEMLKTANTITDVNLVDGALVITYADGKKYNAGNVETSTSESAIENTEFMNVLETNKIYSIKTSAAQIVAFQSNIDASKHNQILIYLKTEAVVGIYWGENITFVDGVEAPDIGVGTYRIIAEFNPVLGKWVVGVIQDGEAT